MNLDTLIADTGIPSDVFHNAAIAAIVAEVIEEATRLDTLATCTPEEFNNRSIRLGGDKLVNIRNADGPQLQLLATQLTAAGLSIPDLLQRKLAA